MAGVRVMPQRVDDQHVEVLQQRQAYFWNVAHVGEIGGGAEAIAGDLQPSMGHRNPLEAGAEQFDASSRSWIDAVNLDAGAGGIAVFFAEGVLEDAFDIGRGDLIGVDRQVSFGVKAEGAQIVEAHDVVGVAVGIQNGIDAANSFAHGLSVKVRAGVNQDRVAIVGDADGGPSAAVVGIGGGADGTVAAKGRHPH